MNTKVIGKTDLIAFLAEVGNKYDVFAPMKKNGSISFEPLSSGADVVFDYPNSLRTPKEFFFPQSEVLFTFRGVEREDDDQTSDAKPRVLFGIRPCDSNSLALLDKVFDQEDYQDSYYIEKRSNTTLIGLACANPQSACFCASVDGGPFNKDGLDLLVTALDGDKLHVEILTEKGRGLIGEDSRFKDAGESDSQQVESLKKEAEAKITSKIPLDGLKEKLDGMFDSPVWDEIHERCLGCAICTYMCPTCHCFALLDEQAGSSGERIRNWDSCMFPIFTLEASGHNPRASNRERMRQRIMHKFNYFVENFGHTACVGCGRCLINCPVNMDIREIIETITKAS